MKLKIILAFLLVTQFSIAQDKRIQQFDSLLTAQYKEKTFNGNVLIAEKGQVLYKKSFGIANEITQEKLDENSIFELASVSKQFTAMAIAILQEKGKLNFDDKLSKFIPELSHYDNITIKHLLHHTSGLEDYMMLMDTNFDKTKIATNKDIIALFAKEKPALLFEPNSEWEYSNTGYALLASIVEKASGMSFGAYLDKVIFAPLKMTNTFVYNRRHAPRKVNNYAYGYVYDRNLKKHVLPDDFEETKIVVWLDGIVGDGTVNSTVNDLLKWDRALYTNKLLSKKGMDQLFEVATLNDGSKTQYGLGWFVNTDDSFGKTVGHGGGWPGYKTYIDRHIDNDKTIIYLQNHEEVNNPLKSLRSILYNIPLPVKKIRQEITLSREQMEKLLGVYEIQPGFELKMTLEDNHLFTQLTGQNAFPVYAESETLLFLKIVDAQLEFEKDEKGAITGLYLLQNGNKISAKKIQ